MAVSDNPNGDDLDRMVQYAIGESFGEAAFGVTHTWQDYGLCHFMFDVFDLPTESDGHRREDDYKTDAKYRLRAARPLCLQCPVFEECWNDAWDNVDNPSAVIQAAALLDTDIAEVRKRRLTLAWDMWKRIKDHGRSEPEPTPEPAAGGVTRRGKADYKRSLRNPKRHSASKRGHSAGRERHRA